MNMQLAADTHPIALRMQGISKRFPGVVALDDVSLDLLAGEVLALVGENGAGKSTLMKILSGAYRADAGTVELFGQPIDHATPHQMLGLGVAVIYQELLLANDLTVAENIYLGRMPRSRFGTVDWKRTLSGARDVIERLGFDIDPRAKTATLSVAQRQIVEIAKSLSQDARVIVLDEPSAVLGDAELEKLFAIVRRLVRDGVGFIYISHRLEEVFAIAERAAVMRDGRLVGVEATRDLTKAALVSMMVGREIDDIYPKRSPTVGKPLLQVEGLSNERLHDITLDVRSGEIVGVCGLAGSGRSELLHALCGADTATAKRFSSGRLGALPASPKKALAKGMGLLPEDRRHQGLFIDQSVAFNVAIGKLANVTRGGVLSRSAQQRVVGGFIDRLRIKTPSLHATVGNLSGGNQQKCVFAKLLNAECAVLFVDEPTRGVDIGAKREIYQLLADLADKQGIGIVMVSSELPEIIGVCDRILVMRGGRITGRFTRDDVSEEKIMHAAAD